MREYGFSLTRILPYKDKIYWRIRVSKKPYSCIFYAVEKKVCPSDGEITFFLAMLCPFPKET